MQMIEQLNKLGIKDWLNVSLSVQTPSAEGFGMYGSGMFVINPSWTLPATLKESMPILSNLLALDETANFKLTSQMT
jgi:23S rRNA (adenine2030-N6)-methyltransferase